MEKISLKFSGNYFICTKFNLNAFLCIINHDTGSLLVKTI